ncbi:MAG: hypothetical protein WKG07_26585 [Hymenobacter sp.]
MFALNEKGLFNKIKGNDGPLSGGHRLFEHGWQPGPDPEAGPLPANVLLEHYGQLV